LVGRLERAGLVVRSADPDDGRLTRVDLSKRADQRISQWRGRRAAVVEHALSSLRPRELAALRRAIEPLSRLAETVESAALGPSRGVD
jgi:DNA-binding MarR family transcriptional regulator